MSDRNGASKFYGTGQKDFFFFFVIRIFFFFGNVYELVLFSIFLFLFQSLILKHNEELCLKLCYILQLNV
jgi:hypothetical protein